VAKAGPRPSPNCGERSSVTRDVKRVAVFHAEFREDLRYWVRSERSVAIRVLDLVEAVLRDPFQGPGKPEPLRYLLAGCWSRRITQEHRLVYRVSDESVDFLQARYHY
jgi:toxin YoeB